MVNHIFFRKAEFNFTDHTQAKTAFCVYLAYLCLIISLFDDLEHLSVANMQKKIVGHRGKGQVALLHPTTKSTGACPSSSKALHDFHRTVDIWNDCVLLHRTMSHINNDEASSHSYSGHHHRGDY